MRKLLLGNYLILIIIGIGMVFSATYKSLLVSEGKPFSELFQIIFIFIIIIALAILILYKKDKLYKYFYKNIELFYFITIGFLFLVLTKVGLELGGANSSISLGVVNFQPLELIKIIMIFYMAKKLVTVDEKKPIVYFLKVLFWPVVSLVLVLLEPDLGGVIILLSLMIVMLLINGKHLKILLPLIGIFSLLGVLIMRFILASGVGYQSDRILAWINPFSILEGAGGNLVQSYIAISNGGIFGTGYLNSAQNTGFLYASSSDFIFSIILEEWGILGGFTVIVLLFTFAYQIYLVGRRSNKKYEYLVCSGIAFLIMIQTAINTGGVTGVIPMTGVTLPFISTGINSFIFLI